MRLEERRQIERTVESLRQALLICSDDAVAAKLIVMIEELEILLSS